VLKDNKKSKEQIIGELKEINYNPNFIQLQQKLCNVIEITKKIMDKDKMQEFLVPYINLENSSIINNIHYEGIKKDAILRFYLAKTIGDQGSDTLGLHIFYKNFFDNCAKENINFLTTLDMNNLFGDYNKIFKCLDRAIKDTENTMLPNGCTVSEYWHKRNKTTKKYDLLRTDKTSSSSHLNFINRVIIPVLTLVTVLKQRNFTLKEYVETYPSAHIAIQKIKNDKELGLSSSVGIKALTVFVKNCIKYNLVDNNGEGWTQNSYDIPIDGNVARVLHAIGFLKGCIDDDLLIGGAKKGKEYVFTYKKEKMYIRATKLRKINCLNKFINDFYFYREYIDAHKNYLCKGNGTPRTIKFPTILNALLISTKYNIEDLNQVLMYIGMHFCINKHPRCSECPIKNECLSKKYPTLIQNYFT